MRLHCRRNAGSGPLCGSVYSAAQQLATADPTWIPAKAISSSSTTISRRGLGYHSTFLVEHHFTGFGQVSASLALLTWLAAKTKTLRLGTAVLVLPWHNPVLLAEQAATIDLLSGGQLDFGVGKGYRHNEFHGFCVPIAEADARFNETLDVIVKSWTAKQRFSHHGKYWNFEDIIVEPPTAQKPHPPMWMGAGSPDSIRQVAARGYNLLLDQFASFEAVAERIAIFKAAVEERGRALRSVGGRRRARLLCRQEPGRQGRRAGTADGSAAPAGSDFECAGRHQEQSQHHDLFRHPRSERGERAVRHARRDRAKAGKAAQPRRRICRCSTAAAWCSTRRPTISAASPAK